MNKTRLAVKLLISALFICLILRVLQGDELARTLKQVDPMFVLISLALSGFMIGISCLKWKVLLRHQKTPISYPLLFRYYLVGYYFTSMLPSNVGEDVARSYYAGRKIGSQSSAAVSVFLERISGLLFLLILVMVTPALRPNLYAHPAIWIPALGAMSLLGFIAGLIWIRRPLKRWLGAIHPRRPSGGEGKWALRMHSWWEGSRGKASSFHQKLISALEVLRLDRSLWAPLLAMTVLFYLLAWFNVYASFRAFGVSVPFTDVAAVVPVVMFVAMIPVAPLASLGLAEGAYVLYFGLVGVSAAEALAMGLLLRCKLLLIGLIGMGIHLTWDARMECEASQKGSQ